MQTTLDQKTYTKLQLKVETKFEDVFYNPTPILEKSEKNEYFEMSQTHISKFKLFLVFSNNIEFVNIVRIKE